ncbi:MAG: N-acetylneuraminate synthase family protein [Rhodospirillales bacterium]
MASQTGQIPVVIGGRPVGPDHPCFVIAEIGSNHNHDLDLAFRTIDAAAEAGVDAVKFQTFRADQHYSKRTPGFGYLNGQDTFELIKSLEIDRDWHAPLKKHAEERGVVFFSSPCDKEAVEDLARLDVAAHKVASFDLPDTRLIGQIARCGKPVILSTGLADWADIMRGVQACRAVGNDQIVLLQCTSLYPAPARLSNLRSMASMAEAFKVLTGYSDHTEGDQVTLAAVALGAVMIEKHFTLDRSLPGPDHGFATEPGELRAMMARIRDVEAALGDGTKLGPRPEEAEMAEKGRRSLHARETIEAGTPLTEDMLVVKRPGYGLPVHMIDQVIGRTAKRRIEADEWITWDAV